LRRRQRFAAQKEKNDDDDIPDGRSACVPQSSGRIFPPARWLGERRRHPSCAPPSHPDADELDDRALRDIGIERSRIESAVRGVIDPDFGRIM